MTEAYPLAWPLGKPRTPRSAQKVGKFSRDGRWITVAGATARVEAEIGRLGGRWIVISTNIALRRDGKPYSGQKEPDDRGVCVYFDIAGQPYAMACDRYTEVADNLAAIAAHIEATRAIARHGVASAAETLQSFQALPAPKRPHEILGIAPDAAPDTIRSAWRKAITGAHPDQGGTEAAAAEINAARDAMLQGPKP